MWNLKKKWYKWIYLQNRLTDTENKTFGYQRGKAVAGAGGRINQEAGINIFTLYYRATDSTQYSVISYRGKEIRNLYKWITVLYTWNYHSTVNQL